MKIFICITYLRESDPESEQMTEALLRSLWALALLFLIKGLDAQLRKTAISFSSMVNVI